MTDKLPEVEVVGYIECPPDNFGLMRWIANVYRTDAETARNIFFAGWPQLTESHFQDVIAGKIREGNNGAVIFDD